jgi:hypothetical protein
VSVRGQLPGTTWSVDPEKIPEFRRAKGRQFQIRMSEERRSLDDGDWQAIVKAMEKGNAVDVQWDDVRAQLDHDLDGFFSEHNQCAQHNKSLPPAYGKLSAAVAKMLRAYTPAIAWRGGPSGEKRREKIICDLAELQRYCSEIMKMDHLAPVFPNFERLLWRLASIWVGAGGRIGGHANGAKGGPFVEFLRKATRPLLVSEATSEQARGWSIRLRKMAERPRARRSYR